MSVGFSRKILMPGGQFDLPFEAFSKPQRQQTAGELPDQVASMAWIWRVAAKVVGEEQ